jgi:hypothetical protein
MMLPDYPGFGVAKNVDMDFILVLQYYSFVILRIRVTGDVF